MQKNLTVSVVIPAFNEAGHIGKTLLSLSNQTVLADEIVIVDNNSSDKTADIVERFAARRPAMGIRLVHESRQGIMWARTKGFDTAKGDILARIDADTQVAHDWVERIRYNFDDSLVVCLGGPLGFIEWSPGKSIVGSTLGRFRHYLIRRQLKLPFTPPFGCNMALRKTSWMQVRDRVQTDEKLYHEDLDLVFELSKHGKISYDPKLRAKVYLKRYLDLRKMKSYLKRDYATREKHFGNMKRI